MKRMMTVAMLLVLATFTTEARQKPTERFRVLVSTDIGGTDPDDNQSVAHLLMLLPAAIVSRQKALSGLSVRHAKRIHVHFMYWCGAVWRMWHKPCMMPQTLPPNYASTG